MSLTLTKSPRASVLTLTKSSLPVAPGQLASLRDWCWYWAAMDKFYATPATSPLHHHNRCERCA